MGKQRKYPLMPFDTGDWLKCPELRAMAPDVRALWMDMLCYMWESPEVGVMVAPNCKPYSREEIVRIVGLDSRASGSWLELLIDSGVCGVRDDGAIYSRRMVRDADLREKRAEAGRKGGQRARGPAEPEKAEISPPVAQSGPIAPLPKDEGEELQLFPPGEGQVPRKKKKSEPPKIQFAENVWLTQVEYDKLVIEHGKQAADWMVRKLDNSKGSNGRVYKSDYRAILNWVVDAYYDALNKGYVKQQYNRDAGSSPQTASGFATGSTIPDD